MDVAPWYVASDDAKVMQNATDITLANNNTPQRKNRVRVRDLKFGGMRSTCFTSLNSNINTIRYLQ